MLQVRLDESQIDPGFKSLFRQLAGPVRTAADSGHGLAAASNHFTLPPLVPTGHGDQHHGVADHIEQDHQQTSVTTAGQSDSGSVTETVFETLRVLSLRS